MGSGAFHRLRLLRRRASCRRACAALLAIPAFGLLPAPATAQAVGAADMQIAVLEPGSLAALADLEFGDIIQRANAGTVTLAPTANPTCAVTGGLVRSGACRAAAFGLFGRKNWRVRLRTTGGNTVTLTGPGGATMTVTNLTFAPVDMSATNGAGAGWNLGRYQIDSTSGMAMFYLGGTLNVGAMQAPGAYSGTVVVEAQFN